MRQEQSVELPRFPNRLRLMPNNELWQCHRGGITVLDAELRLLREIESKSDSDDMGDVYDVAVLPDEDIAVAGLYGLFQVDYAGKCIVLVWIEIESKSDSGDMGWVYDVAALPDGDVAFAGSKGLFLIDHDGNCFILV